MRDAMMTETLKSCPFCGSRKVTIIERSFFNFVNNYGVECDYCNAQTYQFFESKKDAIKAWNRREQT